MFEKLEEIRRKYEEVRARLEDPEFVQDHRAVRDARAGDHNLLQVLGIGGARRRRERDTERKKEQARLGASRCMAHPLTSRSAAARCAAPTRALRVRQAGPSRQP